VPKQTEGRSRRVFYDPAVRAEVPFDEPEPTQRGSDEWLAWTERFLAEDPIEFAKWATRLRGDDRRRYKRLMARRHAGLRRELRREFGLLSVPVLGLIWAMAISHGIWTSVARRIRQVRRRSH
jgi:hypothetical protein